MEGFHVYDFDSPCYNVDPYTDFLFAKSLMEMEREGHYRCVWGKVTRHHDNSRVVRAKFKLNVPPNSIGNRVKVGTRALPMHWEHEVSGEIYTVDIAGKDSCTRSETHQSYFIGNCTAKDPVHSEQEPSEAKYLGDCIGRCPYTKRKEPLEKYARVTAKIFSLTCSSSSCKRNWRVLKMFDDENERDDELIFIEEDGLIWNVVAIDAGVKRDLLLNKTTLERSFIIKGTTIINSPCR
ncbi:hypothetical protein Ddye_012044 [Dipteronia dyeriana]|uniref:Uncharacterized protein n=1 Tax=Dipteronia dyeriana TaxID=168575 RepID=A0AAD9X3K3_9ROSI|nr:hypothetical protein Ddye_012044 [Dipteronia dyeriana]